MEQTNTRNQPMKALHAEGKVAPRRIFINFVGKILVADLSEIVYLKGVERYTHIVMKDGTRHISSKSLKNYVIAIERHPDFLRVHRSSLINKNYVHSLVREGNDSKYSLKMYNGEVLEISKFKKDDLVQALLM